MADLLSGSVSLTVTSPPYWNAIDYDSHALDASVNYRNRTSIETQDTYEDYLLWLESIFTEVHRVTKPGGFCAVVIGTLLLKGKMFPIPFDLASRMCNLGWSLHQDIVWHKCTGGVKRAGVFIQHPFPGYYYPNIMTEYILVFHKKGPKIYNAHTFSEKQNARTPIDRLFTMEIANNIWHIAPVPPGTIAHPCPFPEEIPYRLINLYSYPGDIILDPFVGSGQTTKVANYLKRQFVGYDTISEYATLAESRTQEPSSLRPKQLFVAFKKVDLIRE